LSASTAGSIETLFASGAPYQSVTGIPAGTSEALATNMVMSAGIGAGGGGGDVLPLGRLRRRAAAEQ